MKHFELNYFLIIMFGNLYGNQYKSMYAITSTYLITDRNRSMFADVYSASFYRKLWKNRTDKKYQCPNCPSIFVWKCTLKRHLRNECGKEPRFKCPHCNYRGKWKANISRHIKRVHKNCSIYVLTTNSEWSRFTSDGRCNYWNSRFRFSKPFGTTMYNV